MRWMDSVKRALNESGMSMELGWIEVNEEQE